MPQTLIRGMAWQHRRAVDPLLAASRLYERTHPDVQINWEARPLHGFEFTSVAELAREYELIVLDHPFMGEVAETHCVLPLDEELRGVSDRDFIGPSLTTYRYDDALWAVPVDAACQTALYRPDLLEQLSCDVPRSIAEVLELGRQARLGGFHLAIAFAGVHTLMTFLTLCAALGRPCELREDALFADPTIALESLALLRGILAACPPDVLDWNSIRLHEAMIERDDLVYCPAVYCYATYAEADMRRPLRFADLPAMRPGGEPKGSTIGGAGVAVSAQSAGADAAMGFLRFLADADTQRMFTRHHGQPARIEAWDDADADARFGGTFSATRRTMELSWIRPRWPGYLTLQAEGSRLIEAHLRGLLNDSETIARLNDAAATARR